MNLEDIDNDPTLTPKQKRRKKEYWINAEANREATRRWFRENRARAKLVQKEWIAKNIDKNRELKRNVAKRYREKWVDLIQERRNAPEFKEKQRMYKRSLYMQAKQDCVNAYGGKCACCGEDHVELLTLDHINNDGKEQRRAKRHSLGSNFYRQLVRAGFPKGELQLLCWNCNLGKHYYGVCPHQKPSDFKTVKKIA